MLSSVIGVKENVDLIVRELVELIGLKNSDSGTSLLREPADHDVLCALTAVFDLLSVVEEEESGESLNLESAFHAGVFVSIDLGESHLIFSYVPGDPES